MKNEKSSSRGSNASHEKRDSEGRFESSNSGRGSHSSSSSNNGGGNSGQKRDSEGRFTSENRGRKSEK